MHNVHIQASRPYDVLIGSGLISNMGTLLSQFTLPCRVAIITDSTVDALYGEKVQHSLQKSGFSVCKMHFSPGEAHKNLQTYAQVLGFLCENQITRSDIILALGGGVVGDLAGFSAATYLRGVRFVQLPTTLLAMVDASVGGKTAIDLPHGKNLCGAFWQPSMVICDTDTLLSLPEHTMTDGLAECFKHGILQDENLFELLRTQDIRQNINEIVARNVRIKAAFVTQDERDTGIRRQLNLGHTLGHAIEKLSDYTLSHGQAVAIGTAYAARIAQKLGLCSAAVPERIENAFRATGLPVTAPYSADTITAVALGDKKRTGDVVSMVLPLAIGACTLHDVPVGMLRDVIALGVDA